MAAMMVLWGATGDARPSEAPASIEIETLEAWALARISVLAQRSDDVAPPEASACAHRLLCLAAAAAARQDVWSAWLQREAAFVRRRVERTDDVNALTDVLLACPVPDAITAMRMDQHRTPLTQRELATAFVARADDVAIQAPFEHVPTLVAERKCHLERGMAIALVSQLPAYMASIWERWAHARRPAMRRMAQAVAENDDDDGNRIGRMLAGLGAELERRLLVGSGGTGAAPWQQAGALPLTLTLEQLDATWQRELPLCGMTVHEQLLRWHHLKHYDRIQHALLLKSLGVTWQDIVRLWTTHFLRVLAPDVFRKKRYEYEIRHLFALEGGRIDREPFTCHNLIKHDRMANNCNGCPYRHSDNNALGALLRRRGHADDDIEDILAPAERGEARAACSRELVRNIARSRPTASQGVLDDPPFATPREYVLALRALSSAPTESTS